MDKDRIKSLIAKGEIEKALDEVIDGINTISDAQTKNDFILQSGKLKIILRDKNLGKQTAESINVTIDQIISGVLAMIDNAEGVQEEQKFKSQVFAEDKNKGHPNLIPVFFSLGTPHKLEQLEYVEQLKAHIKKYDIELIALDDDDWDEMDPLDPIRKKMLKCSGCLVLAMERYFVEEGINKRGSKQESKIENQNYTTPWTHIEATMAYILDLPFIILKEDSLKSEGMIDDQLFEWRIVKINPKNPKELGEYPVKQFIRMWVEEIKK